MRYVFDSLLCGLLNPMQLMEGANDARSSDLGRIKTQMATWVETSRLLNPIRADAPAGAKVVMYAEDIDNRGVDHFVCGYLLCPVTLDWHDERFVQVFPSAPNGH